MSSTELVESLIKRLDLSDEEKHILENPPEIIKSSIEYLISFPSKSRNKLPMKQNAWLIFLKNYVVYLRETYPNEKFPIADISVKASVEWVKLSDTDYTKRYFRIVEKIVEE